MSVPAKQKRLYVVEISAKTVIWAESDAAAVRHARENVGDMMHDGTGPDFDSLGLLRSEADLPDGWELRYLPYGTQDGPKELNIGQLVDEFDLFGPIQPDRDTRTIDMFEEVTP